MSDGGGGSRSRAGFVGVLIVVQPSWSVFGPVSLVPALAGALFAVYALLNRRLSAYDTPLTMQFTAGVSALADPDGRARRRLARSAFPTSRRRRSDRARSRFLLLMGVFGTSGHLLFVQARQARAIVADRADAICRDRLRGALGYLVFGDFPDFWKWVGIAIIVGSGAYVFWRESRVALMAGA